MQVVLVMFRSDGERRSFSVVRNMTIIGRREDCDLRIPVGDVSRKHCRLVLTDDGVRIEDLGSSNGTLVNGEKIQESELNPGDIVGIGPVQFIVQIDGVPHEEEMVAPGARPMIDPEDSSAGQPLENTTSGEISDLGSGEFALDNDLGLDLDDSGEHKSPGGNSEPQDHLPEHLPGKASLNNALSDESSLSGQSVTDDEFSLEEVPGSDVTIDEDAESSLPVPLSSHSPVPAADNDEPLEDFEMADALEPLDLAPEHAAALPPDEKATEEIEPVDLEAGDSEWDFMVEETDGSRSAHNFKLDQDSPHEQPISELHDIAVVQIFTSIKAMLLNHFSPILFALAVASTLAMTATGFAGDGNASPSKTMIDYFLPMPVRGELSKSVWGASTVGPRDQRNGLEDASIAKWCYWDGQIIKGGDGRWHLFASRWDQALGHHGWPRSCAVQAVSDDVLGPYKDQGMLWPDNQGGKGHNVTALVMPNGRYAVTISETRPGEVFTSAGLDGPWKSLGRITVQDQPGWHASNVTPVLRPDGDYMVVQRSGEIMISHHINGPYKVMGPSIYPKVKGLSLVNLEDPVAWFSGGLYHIVVNSWSARRAYHLTSPDGIDGWVLRGLAYDPTADFLRCSDGTINHWNKIERPSVLIQDGHVTHFTFAVLDVPKDDDKGNDGHGSKVIVVPFDGAAMDRDLAEIVKREKSGSEK